MICVGPSASAVYIPPTFTRAASTNFNQNSGVLNGTVATTGNRAITSVEFQWSNSSTFTAGTNITISDWTAASTNTTISQGATNTARSANASNLANNTTYYVRFRATNASGFVAESAISDSTSNGNFKTYKLNTSTFTGSSTWTNPVPTSGTSGLAITQILNLECRAGGGGGGSGIGSGGGAGARTTAASATISGNITVTVGGGGGGDSSGGSTSIGSYLSATGGNGGSETVGTTSPSGGASGNGNAGGSGYYNPSDFFDIGTGGGGGTNGVGGNGGYRTYGSGGAGWTSGFGVGGNGQDFYNIPAISSGAAQTGNGGSGDRNFFAPFTPGSGGSGYAQFQYYGP